MRPLSRRISPFRVLIVPLLVATLFLLVLFLVPEANATGGALVWMFQGPEDVLSSGEIQDQDGDGTPDLVVESYDAGASGDHLYCLSGAAPGPNAVTIWSVRPLGGPSNSGGYGSDCLEISEDLNRDGKQDVLLGTAWGARTAFALDGTNGATHWSFDTYSDSPPNPAVSGWVYTITSTPDTNGDQVPDVFFGCGSDNNRFYHASGSSGSVLWSLDLGDAIFSSAALGDVTGDGIPDCAAGVGDNADAVWVLRGGPTGVPLVWNHSMPGTVMALARVSDLTGNGTDDLFAGTWTSQVFAFDGATGDTAWVAFLPGSANVMRLATLDDVNGDSIPDVAVGSWATSVFALSGADGSILWASLTGDDNWAVGRVDDVTGDGINDVVAGSFDTFVYLLDGVTGDQVWKYGVGNRLYWVAGTSDLTGNGVPDVFAGSQKLTSQPGGQGFLIEGGELATPADLPPWTSATDDPRGVLVRLGGANDFDRAWVERHDGSAEDAGRARAVFRREIADAYAAGLLDVRGAIAARSQDPQVSWSRVSASTVEIVGGQAIWVDATAEPGQTYTYRFAYEREGTVVGWSPSATVVRSATVEAIPPVFARPNPAPERVRIDFRIPRAQSWRVEIFDLAGRRVIALDEGRDAGARTAEWDGRDASGHLAPAGIYFARVTAEGFTSSTKITRLR